MRNNPEAFRTLQQDLLKNPGGDREVVEILALALQYYENAVFSAVEIARKADVTTKNHVLNLLHLLVGGKSTTPPTIKASPDRDADANAMHLKHALR